MFKKFTNLNKEVKTVKFGLKPIGATEKFIKERRLIDEQVTIDEKLEKAKKAIDRVYLNIVDKRLSLIDPSIANGLYEVWLKNPKKFSKSEEFKSAKEKFINLMKCDGDGLLTTKDGKGTLNWSFLGNNIDIFSCGDKGLEEELHLMFSNFKGRGAYVDDLFGAKTKVMLGSEMNSLFYRIFNENLVTFFKNARSLQSIEQGQRDNLLKHIDGLCNLMEPNNALRYVLQSDIDIYNNVAGAYASLRQELQSKDKELKLPKLDKLAKQILSEVEKKVQPIESDEEIITLLDENENSLMLAIEKLKQLFQGIGSTYDKEVIMIAKKIKANKGDFSRISNVCLHTWDGIKNLIIEEWKANNPNVKSKDAKANAYYKNLECISLSHLEKLVGDDSATRFLKSFGEISTGTRQESDFALRLKNAYDLLKERYEKAIDKSLRSNENSKNLKVFFDTLLNLNDFIAQIYTGDEISDTDDFYKDLFEAKSEINKVLKEFNKVRNYISKKNYSEKELKVYFGLNANLMNGWTHNEKNRFQYNAIIFKGGDDDYYVGILSDSKIGEKIVNSEPSNDGYSYLDVINMKGQTIGKKIDGFCKKLSIQMPKSVDEYVRLLTCDEWKAERPDLVLKRTEGFNNTQEIYDSLEYNSMRWVGCSREAVNKMVDDGEIYLFKLSCRDFSEYSKGKPQLFTMYLRALFSNENAFCQYYINGSALITFRPKTIVNESNIENFAIHKANVPIKNKRNIDGGRKTATYPYDIEKNKRYKSDAWFFSFPITINGEKEIKQNELNDMVNNMISNGEIEHVIGIDRGERNLLTISVVELKTRKIVEQRSLNIIGNTDYNKLLSEMSDKIDEEKKTYRQERAIKDASEGYVSHAVNEIVQLIKKYNAVVAIEALDMNFKRQRCKVTKNIYTKFENQLVNKLSFLVFKDANSNDVGGVYNPITLAIKPDSKAKSFGRQNGIIFSVVPSYTSNIDPITGFANIIDLQEVKTIASIKNFFNKFDYIRYDKDNDRFELKLDLKNFKLKGSLKPKELTKTEWTLVSSGTKIAKERNPNNPHFAFIEKEATDEFKRAIGMTGNNFMECENIKSIIMQQNSHETLDVFLSALKLTLQMRNSYAERDYITSPALDENGEQFDSRKVYGHMMPEDGDMNGAYSIARRAIMVIGLPKKGKDSNANWLNFSQGEGRPQTTLPTTEEVVGESLWAKELCYSYANGVG